MAERYSTKELLTKNSEQLVKILAELREKMRHVRFQVSAREIKNLRELRFNRREIARVLTVMNSIKKAAEKLTSPKNK